MNNFKQLPYMNSSTLSETLLNARITLRLAQTEVAEHLGIAQSTYNNWESAKHTPSIKHILKLCQILKLELNDILPPPSQFPHNILIIS